ncbi:MAG: hypothetical protein U1F65_02015 [Verrucomicrobiota bacterium]
MKPFTTFTVLAGTFTFSLIGTLGLAYSNAFWTLAGLLGLAALNFTAKARAPKPVPVRIRSQRNRR